MYRSCTIYGVSKKRREGQNRTGKRKQHASGAFESREALGHREGLIRVFSRWVPRVHVRMDEWQVNRARGLAPSSMLWSLVRGFVVYRD